MAIRTRHKSRHRGIYYRNGSDDPRAPGPRRWIVWFEDSEGNGRTETLPEGSSEQDALSRQAELRRKRRSGERVMPTKATLRDAGAAWLADQRESKAPKTLEAYEWGLEKWYEHLGASRKLADITTSDVATAIARMKRAGLSGDSIKAAITPLNRVFARARRDHGLANPVALLEREERPKVAARKMRILDSGEISSVIERTPANYRAAVTTAIFTGLRIGELLELRWRDVDFELGLITVRESKTEAGRGRRVVLIPRLAEVLRAHRIANWPDSPDAYVFSTGPGGKLNPSNLRNRGLKAALAVQKDEEGKVTAPAIPHCRFHDLRHTFASMLIGEGLDVTFVADQLGHHDPAITLKVYAKLFDPKRRRDEAREKLEAAFGGLL